MIVRSLLIVCVVTLYRLAKFLHEEILPLAPSLLFVPDARKDQWDENYSHDVELAKECSDAQLKCSFEHYLK